MDKVKREIELLSPAKNLECGLAAINNGADAVYIGGPGFGARKMAGNTMEDIAKLVHHAHLYRAKVYLTLNTILEDKDIKQANRLIHEAYDTGVDAVIIQDMGLLETDLPPLPVHASTQTDNRTVEKVKFLEEAGFDQVVLARETPIEQIKHIRSQTTVALEYFIHGALCVCYSGQCYMSAAINGRSANKGECAQPCRLKYSLKSHDGQLLFKDKHLLSLKDLNQTPNLEELIDAGISSLKIEGRLKNKEYVANITAHYRKELDALIESRSDLQRASGGRVEHPFDPAPQKSFNRGFTEYFLHGRRDEVWSIHSPKALGEKIGKITTLGQNFFIHDGTEKIANGDGLCFMDRHNQLSGMNVNTVDGKKVFPNHLKGLSIGTLIYRNHDTAFEKSLTRKEAQRKIGITLQLTENDQTLLLTLTDKDGLSVSESLSLKEAQAAKNPAKMVEQCQIQLGKLGNTPFCADRINIDFTGERFIQAAEINELRRKAVDLLIAKRTETCPVRRRQISKTTHPFPQDELDFKANITNTPARKFYERHGVRAMEWGFEKQAVKGDMEVMRTRHCVLHMAGKCMKEHPEARKLLPLTLFNAKDSYALDFDCKSCEMIIIKRGCLKSCSN